MKNGMEKQVGKSDVFNKIILKLMMILIEIYSKPYLNIRKFVILLIKKKTTYGG